LALRKLCARVAKGHVAAAPPNIVMSSSPFTQPTSSELKTPGYQFSHAAVSRLLRCNGRASPRLVWVILRVRRETGKKDE
jgi:hypothetical protein